MPRNRRTAIAASIVLIALSGCGADYYLRAAYEQGRILASRQSISCLLKEQNLPTTERDKLELVQAARDHSTQLGLTPGKTFTKYAKIDRDTLAWVVMGSKRDAFQPYIWWFPIVGSMPYKGYFSKDQAAEELTRISGEGYEGMVRGTAAFSTLGWFNDPLLSTTLALPPHELVNTVIHEIAHTTVWLDGQVEFNESFANFVGLTGAVEFFQWQSDTLRAENHNDVAESIEAAEANLTKARSSKAGSLALSGALGQLYSELAALYQSDLSSEAKLAKREEVFNSAIQPLKVQFPGIRAFKTINNAEILNTRLYTRDLEKFERLWQGAGQSMPAMIDQIKAIKAQCEADPSTDPFSLLEAGSIAPPLAAQ